MKQNLRTRWMWLLLCRNKGKHFGQVLHGKCLLCGIASISCLGFKVLGTYSFDSAAPRCQPPPWKILDLPLLIPPPWIIPIFGENKHVSWNPYIKSEDFHRTVEAVGMWKPNKQPKTHPCIVIFRFRRAWIWFTVKVLVTKFLFYWKQDRKHHLD